MSPLSNTKMTPRNVKKTPNPVKPSPISAQISSQIFNDDFEIFARLSNYFIMNNKKKNTTEQNHRNRGNSLSTLIDSA